MTRRRIHFLSVPVGPTCERFAHQPVVPGQLEDVTISVVAEDPDTVVTMTIWYSVAGDPWPSEPMTVDADGLYQGTIPGQAAGADVQFYVEGTDTQGGVSTFPADGRDSRAMFEVQDNRANPSKMHNVRIIMTPADVTWMYDDVAHIVTPRTADTSIGLLAMARYGDVYLNARFENGSDGTVFNQELAYAPTTTVDGHPESPKAIRPHTHDRSQNDFDAYGDDKETYRWGWQIRSNRGRDDYEPMMQLAQAMALTDDELDAASRQIMDVDQWMRTFSMLGLNGRVDVYTRRHHHNFRVYQRPEDGLMLALPWDMDRAFELATLDVEWTGQDTWRLAVPLTFGLNAVTLRAVDFQGQPIATETITVESALPDRPLQQFLRISEIMYNPAEPTQTERDAGLVDNDDFEYVELVNTSDTVALDISGVSFSNGIGFTFPEGTSLSHGERILVVRNLAAFEARYGTGMNVAAEYQEPGGGNKLANDGETVRLDDSAGGVIQEFAYNDSVNQGWPKADDGQGSSDATSCEASPPPSTHYPPISNPTISRSTRGRSRMR